MTTYFIRLEYIVPEQVQHLLPKEFAFAKHLKELQVDIEGWQPWDIDFPPAPVRGNNPWDLTAPRKLTITGRQEIDNDDPNPEGDVLALLSAAIPIIGVVHSKTVLGVAGVRPSSVTSTLIEE